MKTKLFLTTILVITFVTNAVSQDYHPFLNHSTWIISDWVSCCRPPQTVTIEEGTDVIVGAYTYEEFVDPFAVNSIATVKLREDVAAKKVYKLVNGTDFLLYNFSLENGDTISQYGYTFVATVDEVIVDNGTRKRITLQSIELYHDEILTQVWIEGVGTVAHPFYPNHNMYNVASSGGGYKINTKCSFQNGEHVYGNSTYCSSFVALGTTAETYTNKQIVFSPNPFASALTIDSRLDLEDATFKLYNLQGQLVMEVNNLNGKKIIINRNNLSNGLYLAELSQKSTVVKTAKLMVN